MRIIQVVDGTNLLEDRPLAEEDWALVTPRQVDLFDRDHCARDTCLVLLGTGACAVCITAVCFKVFHVIGSCA